MGRLLPLLLLVPLLELWLLVQLGQRLGGHVVLGGVLLSAVVGAALARREAGRVLAGWRRGLAEGRLAEAGLLEAALVLAGGVLLVVPGVLTDVAGLLLLLPPSRRAVARRVRRHLEAGMRAGRVRVVSFGGSPFGDSPFHGSPSDVGPSARTPPAAPPPSFQRPRGPVEEAEVVEE